jgi:hypothetical protein
MGMPEMPIVYDDVEVLDHDGLGFTCRIGNRRAFIDKYVPVDGTTVHRKGDRGRLTLPRWFVQQQGLPLSRHMTDSEVDEWFANAQLRVLVARDALERLPDDAAGQAALSKATRELAAAIAVRAQRQGEPRR